MRRNHSSRPIEINPGPHLGHLPTGLALTGLSNRLWMPPFPFLFQHSKMHTASSGELNCLATANDEPAHWQIPDCSIWLHLAPFDSPPDECTRRRVWRPSLERLGTYYRSLRPVISSSYQKAMTDGAAPRILSPLVCPVIGPLLPVCACR